MATRTLGTTAQTSLTALAATPQPVQADFATIANSIKDDGIGSGGGGNPANPYIYNSWELNGFLYIPNRGRLIVYPGDWVGVDSQGWPVLISKNSIANAAWTHS